ncbi:hypothetical protein DBP19_09790 [Streptomyces sp. CS090A]|uniref:hypothetical protein n=1 Tax=Streptomyces sp. CS090A TaxID=2162710 RepID=UPI000D50FBCF|nr:hypothetical protein [Streptomyces sp. CS090A]PVC96584.1 hypothetical protein DBP19_09790 [Streptomyces sp. CS090A]
MSENDPVDPYGIPVFTGDLAVLDQKVTALAKDGEKIATAAGDVHSSFGGLRAFYQAPEADQLFATMQPVTTTAQSLKSDVAVITGALATYADDAQPLVAKLKRLREEASTFLDKANADDKWREDGDLVEENNRRHGEIAEAWAAFQAVERNCYNKIISLVPGGTQLKVDDGSGGKGMYGYDAEALKHAKGLPWGDPVKESTPWYHIHEHLWDFGKGVVVDGVWGTIKGLGTLVGTDGWESMKQAWTGLAKLTTGIIISTTPLAAAFWLTPEDKLPSWLRDSRTAMKETGKALLAWDQWSENPSRAAGAVTFNVVTTVFTGGTGGAVAGGGKAALAAKALSFAGKAGRVIDPMTYLFKGAGAGLTKISDVMAGLKGMGNIEIPTLPPGSITLPDGGFKLADGTLHLPEGAAIPDGAFEVPKGAVKLPDGMDIPAGAVDLGDGVVRLPEGMTPPAGSLPIPEGALKLPEGTVALPENTVRLTDMDGNAVHIDAEGNLLKEDGTLKQHHSAAPDGNPADGAPIRTDADTPLPRTPAEESALVGAGARTGGGDSIRLGSDFGDTGRLGDDAARTGDNVTAPDRTPGGTANNLPGGSAPDNLPTNSVDNGTPGSTPRGGPGDHLPANHLDGGGPTGAGSRDLPGGSAADNGIPSGGSHTDGVPSPRNPDSADLGGVDDAARGSDGTSTPPGAAHQPVPRPTFMLDGPNPYGRPGSLTLEQIEDIQVYRANEEPGYFDQYYRSDGTRKRVEVHDASGYAPPQLARLSEGTPWIRAKDAPAPPPPHFLDEKYVSVGADTVKSRERLRILDAAARKRHASILWDNLTEKLKAVAGKDSQIHGDLESMKLLDETTQAYKESHTQMRDASEEFGEKVAEYHFAAERYPDFEKQHLLGPKNGNDQFDQVWLHEDGRVVVIEAKSSPTTDIGSRALPGGKRVSQGSREYFLDILQKMESRGETDLVDALETALEQGKLDYVVVKGGKNSTEYTGYQYRRFDISKGTLP